MTRLLTPRSWLPRREPRAPEPAPEAPSLLRATNLDNGEVLATRVSWAGTSEERRRGLLGRDHLGVDEGIYIVPCQWIHMFGMKFAIDVAFLDARGRVLVVHHSLAPNRLSRIALRAEGALELASGRLAATQTRAGHVIELL